MFKIGLSEANDEKRSIRLFFTISFLFFMTIALYMPYLSAHYVSLGIDSGRIGILTSFGSAASILILPIWSRVSDRTGNRRAVLKIICLGASLTILLLLVSKTFWPLVFTIFIFSSFGWSFIPLSDAITITYLSNTNVDISKVRVGGSIGYCVALLFSGYLYGYNPALSFICASASFLLLFLFVRKIPQVEVSRQKKPKLDLRRLFRNKKVLFLFFFAFCFQITFSFYLSFIGVFVTELGYSSREIANTQLIAALVEIPILLFVFTRLRRFPVTGVALFCGFLMAARLLFVSTAQTIGTIYLADATAGLTFIVFYYSSATFINNEMDDDMKSTGQSALSFFQMGLGSITGNVLGGFISQLSETRYTFLYYGIGLGAICMLCTIVLIVMRIRKSLGGVGYEQ